MVLLAGAMVLILVVLIVATPADALRDPVVLTAVIPVLAVLVLFSSLTVEVDGEALRIVFGPGFVRHTWSIDRIRSWRAVRNPWWYGRGVHLTPGGWLYNVSGYEAVEIVFADGRRCRIGTDDPSGLINVLEAIRRL